jgi:hypothetical protein
MTHDDAGPKEWQRFFMGYKERFVDNCDVPLCNGKTISVAQAPSASASAKRLGGRLDKASDPALTGTTVWDGSIVLAQYLTATDALKQHGAYPSGSDRPANCIELGAGTGVVSLALAACNSVDSVTVTDIPDVLPHLRHCARINKHSLGRVAVDVKPLRWSFAEDVEQLQRQGLSVPVDLIVGADLIYYTYSQETPHSELLLTTLDQLASSETVIYLALSLHHNPEEVESFLQRASPKFHVTRIAGSSLPEEYDVPDVTVVKLRKR